MQAHRFFAIGCAVNAVRVEAALQGFAAFFKGFRQRAFEDAQPVAVSQHLVVGIHGGHRVFQVEDGGQRCFNHQISYASRVCCPNGGGAVDDQVQVQAVVLKQHAGGGLGFTLEADELAGILQTGVAAVRQFDGQLAALDAVGHRVDVRALAQRRAAVEHVAGVFDDLGTALGVVAATGFFAALGLGNHVGAVQRVVQTAPAGVSSVEGVAGVQDRHHQLRAGLFGQLGIDVAGADASVFRGSDQVADFVEVGVVRSHILDRSGVGLVPVVQLGLQQVTLFEQGDVFRG
ncbi:hypothetical protein GALL_510560 [mine drainage metagenome]|uniref:Uncharacterized protein n=1 Tax=mine drainage metagenome TaxID=410659 RepID=A0A1J5PUZ0_9ZZZZ